MSVHWKNELVDSVKIAVVSYGGENWYCYAKSAVTLKNGDDFLPTMFLKMKPNQVSSAFKAVELPYETRVEIKSGRPVVARS
jgi:hypothetical protein